MVVNQRTIDSRCGVNLISDEFVDKPKLDTWKPGNVEEHVVQSIFGEHQVTNQEIKLKVKLANEVALVDLGIMKTLPCPCVLVIPYFTMVCGVLIS